MVKDVEANVHMSTSILLLAPYVDPAVLTRAIRNKVQVVCIGNDLDKVVADEHGNPVPGRDRHVRTLELFTEVTSETQHQPVSGEDPLEQGTYASVKLDRS